MWHAWHLATLTFVSRGRRGTYGTGSPVTPRHFAWKTALGDISRRLVGGMALGDIDFALCGRRGTYGTVLALVARLGPLARRDAAALCVVDMALSDLSPHFGRHGTWRHRPSFHVACVALMALGRLWWCAWGSLVAHDAHFRGRRGTCWRHLPSFCVAGMALGDIDLRFAGKPGTYGTRLVVVGRLGPLGRCVAGVGVALGDMDIPFVWQAWHLRHGRSICVASVALGHIDLRFPWQAWHLVTSTFTLHGRRGTWSHRPSFCVACLTCSHV